MGADTAVDPSRRVRAPAVRATSPVIGMVRSSLAAMTERTVPTVGRWAFAITGLCAAAGFCLSVGLAAFAVYPEVPGSTAHSFGVNADGFAGFVGRVMDILSYFTELSNVVVAVVLLTLAFSHIRPTALWRTLRMDTLVMISVTGLVYQIVLAPAVTLRGWEYVSNALLHTIVPVLTVVTFLIWGPRGWLRWTTVFSALVLPIIWLVYTLIRGAIVGAYPYPFINAANLGIGGALFNVLFVVILGVILGFIFLGLDRLIMKFRRA